MRPIGPFDETDTAAYLWAVGLGGVRLARGVRCILDAPEWVLRHPLVFSLELWEEGGLLEIREMDKSVVCKAILDGRARLLRPEDRPARPPSGAVRSTRVVSLPERTFTLERAANLVLRARHLDDAVDRGGRGGVWLSVEAWLNGQRVNTAGLHHQLDRESYPEHALWAEAFFEALSGLMEDGDERSALNLGLRAARRTIRWSK